MNEKKQVLINLAFNIAGFGINILLGLWLAPYLLNSLGKAVYGLVPLAAVFTEYASVISSCISRSIGRFLTIEIHKKESSPEVVFSTAFFLFCFLAVVQIPLYVWGLYNLESAVNIPPGFNHEMFILVVCSIASFFVNTIQGVFQTLIFSENRLDKVKLIEIAWRVSKLVSIVLLFSLNQPSLRFVGYAEIISIFIKFMLTLLISSEYRGGIELRKSHFSKSLSFSILKMAFWVFVGQFGTLLFLKTDVWIANKFISPSAAGVLGVLNQWPNLLRVMGGLLAGITAPLVFKHYAKDNLNMAIVLCLKNVEVISYFLGAGVGILIALSSEILSLWLGAEYSAMHLVLTIMVVHLVINIGVSPLFQINTANNTVKIPGLLNIVFGGFHIASSVILCRFFEFELLGIVTSAAFWLSLKNIVFYPLYLKVTSGVSLRAVLKSYLRGLLLLTLIVSFSLLGRQLNTMFFNGQLVSLVLLVSITTCIASWLMMPKWLRLGIVNLKTIRNYENKPNNFRFEQQ